jgi:hypothetical protein
MTASRRALLFVVLLAAVGGTALGAVGAMVFGDDDEDPLADGCPDASDPREVIVYLDPAVSDRAVEAMRELLEHDDRIDSVSYVDQDETYEELLRLFADVPSLIEEVTPEVLPTSYRVELEDAEDADAVEADYTAEPGVREVVHSGRFAQVTLPGLGLPCPTEPD